jgi:hypothetical protein
MNILKELLEGLLKDCRTAPDLFGKEEIRKQLTIIVFVEGAFRF